MEAAEIVQQSKRLPMEVQGPRFNPQYHMPSQPPKLVMVVHTAILALGRLKQGHYVSELRGETLHQIYI